MKKIIVIVALALVLVPNVANAKTYHIVKTYKIGKVTSVARYGYVYHRLATIKCPFAGCRTGFSHK